MNSNGPAQTYQTEAEDLLVRIEAIALELSPGTRSPEEINQLFRAFHTIKGSGAMFGFDAVAAFTHHVETALDYVREGALEVSKELIGLILQTKDHIQLLLQSNAPGSGEDSVGAKIIGELGALLPDKQVLELRRATTRKVTAASDTGATEANALLSYEIFFRPPLTLMTMGTNPVALLNELRSLGECRIKASTDRIPPLDQLQPDYCYLDWNITLQTTRDENAIRDVFMFVENESEIRIKLVDVPKSVDAVKTREAKETQPQRQQASPKQIVKAEPNRAEDFLRKSAVKHTTLRVPAERLDRLVNLVGELVMNQSRLSQVAALANVPNLAAPVEEMERLVDELRNSVLDIRMMPIGTTFSRFKRLVHDLSAELHKEIDLVTEGADTELDKTVLDQLGDPLVHLIRNSIDHGVESPEVRLGSGKSQRGIIRLAAEHVGSNVVITISDDGRGIDRAGVRAKAMEKGFIDSNANLSEREVLDLIFRPGFSTAKEITGVSGRGVGMDVVKRQLDALRGQITMSSEAGKGTTFTLTLPLTLAIIDGLLVQIGCDRFIVPMAVVNENVELHRSERGRSNGRNVVTVRGELVPYVRLREAFSIGGTESDLEKIVIARHGEDRVGLVVDRVLGSHQTVIQPLGRFYRNVNLVSGATIMGDGSVALILDLAGVVHAAESRNERSNQIVAASLPATTTATHVL